MATTQQLLDEASAAYHRLMTGTAARVVVDTDGTRVEYAVANAPKLYAYIQDLQSKLAAESPSVTVRDTGPLQFFF